MQTVTKLGRKTENWGEEYRSLAKEKVHKRQRRKLRKKKKKKIKKFIATKGQTGVGVN